MIPLRTVPSPWIAVLLALLATAAAVIGRGPTGDALASGPDIPEQSIEVGGRIATENACYVRLPDMPGARYGGFGGYNEETGVLAYVGGAEKRTETNTIAYHDLYAIKLDGPEARWSTIPYGANEGYTRDVDKGCREMATVQLSHSRWLSVFGKDGCDNGAFDSGKKGGDLKEMIVGASATGSGVSWVPNSGARTLPARLEDEKGRLIRAFAAHDTKRNRVIIGQGTFDDAKESLTRAEVYAARPSGNAWQVTEIRPSGTTPSPRFGSCAAYVHQPDTDVDGVLVLGGQQGGTVGTTSHKEVWWLDFSGREAGEWHNITERFGNLDAMGFRREGACAYDPDTMEFYSWMGRASSSVPEGASRSAGAWRVNLANLDDGEAPLTWERLAPDKLTGISGRRLIPSVFDFANKRLFVMGGRNDLDEYSDVWAIYPDVTGAACENLDPWTVPIPEPTTTTAPQPTRTPQPGGTPLPGPTVQPWSPRVCDEINGRVPAAALAASVADPNTVHGYGLLCYPNRPAGPFNAMRQSLSIRNNGAPYHPVYNSLVWKCGCP